MLRARNPLAPAQIRSRAGRTACALLLFLGLACALPGGLFAQDEPTPNPLDELVGQDESDPKAVEVIDRYLEAVGGKETLLAIQDRVERFNNKKLTPTGETVMKMARFLARPVLIREEWELPGMGITKNNEPLNFVQVYDGESGWVKAMGFVSPLQGKTLTVFVWDKHIDDFFATWRENGWKANYVGPVEHQGKPAEAIELESYAGNQRVRYVFSAEDGLLLSKAWSEGQAPSVIRKEVTFDEYLKIRFRDNPEKWVRHATTHRIFEDGELTLEKVYTEITLNGGLPATTFARPDGPDYDPAAIQKRREEEAKEESEPEAEKKPVWEKPKKPTPGDGGRPAPTPAPKPTPDDGDGDGDGEGGR